MPVQQTETFMDDFANFDTEMCIFELFEALFGRI
jgi:hypothetical protein